MICLLDTHALIWWMSDDTRLSAKARKAIANGRNEILVSPASAYEIAYKNHIGKLPLPPRYLDDLTGQVTRRGFRIIPIDFSHTLLAGRLASSHRDPFDRLLAAQAISANASLITADPVFACFPKLTTLW